MNKYVLNGVEYPIKIIRKNNKNTYIRVRDNTIIVTTNYFVTINKIEQLINDNSAFIDSALVKDINKNIDSSFRLFGKKYDIIYGFPNIEIEKEKIYAKDEKTLNKFLSKYIYNKYEERVNYWYNIFEEKIPRPNLKIRKMTSRWGVCNIKNNNVTLNLELSRFNIEILDYVIVHELAHFIHPNHSKDFWLLVGKYYPKYKDARKYLKNNS